MSNEETILQELREASLLLERFIKEEKSISSISKAVDILGKSIEEGNKILSCGNGGSHCDAMHFAEELTGRFREDRPGIAAIAISDVSHISCVGNDYGFDFIFSRYVEAVGRPGDCLLAISTSGNSTNIINAATEAKKKGMKVIGLTGKDGGRLKDHCDVEIRVNHNKYADRIQEMHIKIIHIIILLLEKRLFS